MGDLLLQILIYYVYDEFMVFNMSLKLFAWKNLSSTHINSVTEFSNDFSAWWMYIPYYSCHIPFPSSMLFLIKILI